MLSSGAMGVPAAQPLQGFDAYLITLVLTQLAAKHHGAAHSLPSVCKGRGGGRGQGSKGTTMWVKIALPQQRMILIYTKKLMTRKKSFQIQR